MRERESQSPKNYDSRDRNKQREMGAMIVWIRTRICWWRPERPGEN